MMTASMMMMMMLKDGKEIDIGNCGNRHAQEQP